MKIGGNFAFKKIQDESINMEFNYECATVEGVGIKTSILLLSLIHISEPTRPY